MGADEQPMRTVYRGKLTGFRVFLTCVLGAWLGFVPGFLLLDDIGGGFLQAPVLILAILSVTLIFRCNLPLFVLTAAVAKALCIVSMGLLDTFGQWLAHGPLESFVRYAANTPVWAWCGFQFYATLGGTILGLAFGLVWYLLVKRALRKSIPAAQAAERHVGMPLRLSGVIATVVLFGLAWGVQKFAASSLAQEETQHVLATSNGATVDLEGMHIDLAGGKIELSGLAMADRSKLDFDLFRATTLMLELDTAELAAKRFVIKDITATAAKSDVKRQEPGKPIGEAPPPPPPKQTGEMTLEDYIAQAELWEQRLRQANEWIEMFFHSTKDETAAEREKRLAEERILRGPAFTQASHLIEGTPLVLIKKVSLTDILRGEAGSDSIDIVASNLSSDPSLVKEPASLSIGSKQKTFGLSLQLDGKTGKTRTKLFHNAIPVDAVMAQLKGATKHVQGGTLAISLGGDLDFKDGGMWLDLPLNLSFKGTTLHLNGMQPTKLDKLDLPLGLSGPLRSPRIRFDSSQFADALVAAGRAELGNQLRKQADKLLGDKVPGEVKNLVNDLASGKGLDKTVDNAKQAAQDAAAKVAADAKKRAAAEMQKKLGEKLGGPSKKAQDDLKKKAGDALKKGLGGLLGGKKK